MLQFVAAEPLSTTIEVSGQQTLENVVGRLHASGVPDDEIRVERISCPDVELTDDDLSFSVHRGVLFGLPGIYLVVVAMALLAGTSLTDALWMALLPALFCGPFFAGFVFLNSRLGRIESADHLVHEHEVDQIVVTGARAADVRSLLEDLSTEAA